MFNLRALLFGLWESTGPECIGALVRPERQIPLKLGFWHLRLANRAVTLRVHLLRSTANHLEQIFKSDDNYELVKILI